MKKKLFTVGYTLFQDGDKIDVRRMLNCLMEHGVNALVDVRSKPFSKQYPQCNKEQLREQCANSNIQYVHIPELGAHAMPNQDVFSKASEIFYDNVFPIAKSNRPEKEELNQDDEIVDFQKIKCDEIFLDGIRRIERAYDQNFTVAIMCSERDPLSCHRYFLISEKLTEVFGDWLEVLHVSRDEHSDNGTKAIGNDEVSEELKKEVLKQEKIENLNINQPDIITGSAPLSNYWGDTKDEQESDFCFRYWNLLHGWKRRTERRDYEAL
ncbi:MAG: DUF488 domain-containing protein [Coriobacteriales bacterium]|nr:DUF488 domain-containing protein [Coriobacteriales bacterium]